MLWLCCRRFKALADHKKGVTDDDVVALVSDEVHKPEVVWELLELQVRGESSTKLNMGSRQQARLKRDSVEVLSPRWCGSCWSCKRGGGL